MGQGILDLTTCWGPPVDAPAPDPRPGLPLAVSFGGSPRLQWTEGQAPYRSATVSALSLASDAARGAARAPAPAPLTSSLLKELLVTDHGLGLEPGAGLGRCGACIWDRGVRALATGGVALAGACFAAGHPPVPPRLVRGIDPHGTAWTQFWCVYYAWAQGHAAVVPRLQALVRARRLRAGRRLVASVRLLPLAGGAATAATVNGLLPESAVRSPLALLPKLQPRVPRARAGSDAGLPELVGPDCPEHGWLPGAEPAPAADPDPPDAGRDGAPGEALPEGAGAASPLAPIVNGMLGFPDTLFVGPTYDAAQRKTGSAFRPFHSVEEALRHAGRGQTVALLPGVYSPVKVCDVHADARAPVRIQGLGRVVIATPQKLPWRAEAALVKVRNCNNVVLAGLEVRTSGLGIDIEDNCYIISLQGIVMENVGRACRHPVARYHNIQFVFCVLNERRHTRMKALARRLGRARLRPRWVYVGVAACLLCAARPYRAPHPPRLHPCPMALVLARRVALEMKGKFDRRPLAVAS